MKPEYIAKFEKLGLGMFVHFGLYSMIGKGEWIYANPPGVDQKYYFSAEFANKFNPKKDWAKKLVKAAKNAGAKYITLTTKHHEGFCLFDACGTTDWDALHYGPKRDLIREFVDACNEQGIIPFFYYAILDWHKSGFDDDFKGYTDYLIDQVEILCKNYGKIGGLWFDGYWSKPDGDWQFDRLYKTIRKYQPEAMIINNTGMGATGEVSHYEIDSVTFERGNPRKISSADGKERAGEMCEVFGAHWGYCLNDISYKPMSQIIDTLVVCRDCNCNLLMNTGPKGDGSLRDLDSIFLKQLGMWIKTNKNFIYNVRHSDVECEGGRLLTDGTYYYAYVPGVDMIADANVQLDKGRKHFTILNGQKIKEAKYLDNGDKVVLDEGKKGFSVKPFAYGTQLCARVIRFKLY